MDYLGQQESDIYTVNDDCNYNPPPRLEHYCIETPQIEAAWAKVTDQYPERSMLAIPAIVLCLF
jgi:hypothetical protein